MADLTLIAVVLAIVAATRVRIAKASLTSPMIFIAAGVLLGPDVLDLVDLQLEREGVSLLAEFTLALLLFADASRIDVRRLRASISIPARLLGIGLPLTIALGTVVTALLLTDLGWAEAALVAAILAPTDAALGEAVVTNEAVPIRVRQALNVESGLNDGLAVPAVTIFLSLAIGSAVEPASEVIRDAIAEIGIGVGVGVLVAYCLARLSMLAMARSWSDAEGYRLVMLAGAVVAFSGSTAAGGNGFIAAFVAGLFVRMFAGDEIDEQTELTEDAGQIGAAATFVVFGSLMVVPALDALSVPVILCALAMLTVGRMLPVWVALLGSGMRPQTVAFIGWFGPRGLASMVFGLLVLEEEALTTGEDLFSVIVIVIVTSVVLHGVSAEPLATRYGAWFARHGHDDMEEMVVVPSVMARSQRR